MLGRDLPGIIQKPRRLKLEGRIAEAAQYQAGVGFIGKGLEADQLPSRVRNGLGALGLRVVAERAVDQGEDRRAEGHRYPQKMRLQ